MSEDYQEYLEIRIEALEKEVIRLKTIIKTIEK